MAKVGGVRKGAGRPKGAKTKRTREIAKQAALTGKTPLEIMLEGMRHYQAIGDRDKAVAIAKDAAPYMHPRLNSVNVGGPIETKDVSLPELARRIAFIFNQAAREKKAGLIEDSDLLALHLADLGGEDRLPKTSLAYAGG